MKEKNAIKVTYEAEQKVCILAGTILPIKIL